ncbi:MAG TPA: histidine kinase [Spirochaetia bacterium]
MTGRQSRVAAMRAVLEPRFAANVLSSLIGLNREGDRARLESALLAAGRMIRILGREGVVATLGEELDFVEAWLELQKLRFDTRLSFRIETDATFIGRQVRRFRVFELVSDAVENSIEPPSVGGLIVVRCRSVGRHGLRIVVSDDRDLSVAARVEMSGVEPRLRREGESRWPPASVGGRPSARGRT